MFLSFSLLFFLCVFFLVYVKHVCYTNFTKFNLPTPIYINLVRDPIERIISWFYYIRAPWYVYFLFVLFVNGCHRRHLLMHSWKYKSYLVYICSLLKIVLSWFTFSISKTFIPLLATYTHTQTNKHSSISLNK